MSIRRSVWLLLLLAYAAALAFGVFGLLRPASPGVTFVTSGSVVAVASVVAGSEPWYEGVQAGDEVIAINGEGPSGLAAGVRIESVTFRNAATGAELPVQIYSRPTTLIDEAVTLNLLGLAFILMCVFGFLRARPTSQVASFSLLAAAAAITLAIAPASIANHSWARVTEVVALYPLSVFFVFFFAGFGANESSTRSAFNRRLPEISLAVAAGSLLLWVPFGLGAASTFGPLRDGAMLLLAGSLVAGLAALVFRYFKADRDVREQMRIAAVGTGLGLVPFLWLSIIPQVVAGSEIVRAETAILTLGLMPLGFGYAIMRHRLMGIRRLVHSGTVYALITAAIIVLYGTVVTIVNLAVPESENYRAVEVGVLLLLVASLPLMTAVRRKAVGVVDRILYRDVMEPDDIVRALSGYGATVTDTGLLLSRSVETLGEGLGIEYAVAVALRDGQAEVSYNYGEVTDAVRRDILAASAAHEGGASLVVLPNVEQEVIVGTVHGIGGVKTQMVMGPRRSQEAHEPEGVRLLQTVCGVMSGSMARIQLLQEVRTQGEQLRTIGTQIDQAHEYERAEISSYLHDEPLQKVAQALAQMRERSLPEDLARLLEDAARDLRSTSASLSPDIIREMGLVEGVRWAVEEQKKRGGFNIILSVEGVSPGERFTPDVELAAYRTVQEALNNCRKHAEPRAVWVRVARSIGQLTVTIEDNGKGLDATAKTGRRPEEGLGLRGLKRRVEGLGGTLTISQRASRGTVLSIILPVENPAHSEDANLRESA